MRVKNLFGRGCGMIAGDFNPLGAMVAWWCIGGVVGALIGSIKGRPLAGFVWGFLLGPLGWVVALVLSPDSKRLCPACHGVLPDNQVTRCRHCGEAVKPHKTRRTFGKRPAGYQGAEVILPEFDEDRI